jgi:RND family efflux transporter MFP subunit
MNVVDTPGSPRSRSSTPLVGVVLVLLLAVGAACWGVFTRTRALAAIARETRDTSVPVVNVVTPQRAATGDEISLPGTMQAYADAAIYARTSGYLRRWYADIGTKVRAGQTLADIDIPEIDQQLLQARADLATATANLTLAKLTADRYRDLITTDSVSRLDLDNANGSLEAKQAAVESAAANVKRLEQLQAFSHVQAPFAGVVTARNVDVGALIGVNAKELFHVAATQRLRVFVNVPEIYARAARPGLHAALTLREFPGRRFAGTLARTAQAIDVASRTLLTEVDVDNAAGELLPGSYADVHLKLPTPTATLRLPVNAIIFKTDGLQVAVVSGERVSLVSVTLGRDFGTAVEVLTGLRGDEQVIINPSDSLLDGAVVHTKRPE